MAEATMTIETPAVVIDLDRLDRNIARMQTHAERMRVTLHPHIKTHKSLEIARRQLARGAAGVTASKASEAAVFVRAGLPSVTIAYPLISSSQFDALLTAAKEAGTRLRFIVDSDATIGAACQAANRHSTELDCLLKVDVGLGRVGVRPQEPKAAEIAQALEAAPGLKFAGLLSHAGHAYGCQRRSDILEVAEAERQLLSGFAATIGLASRSPTISTGCTPIALAEAGIGTADDPVITEIRPGNYVFLDLTAIRLGVAEVDDAALFVLTTVVSEGRDHAIIDAGSKILTTDLGPHGTRNGEGYGIAFPAEMMLLKSAGDRPRTLSQGWPVERLSEEHGFVRTIGSRLVPGTRLAILPNHSCSVANLAPRYEVLSQDGRLARWEVDAGGCIW